MLSLPADYVAEQREYRAVLESPIRESVKDFGAKAMVRDKILKNDIKKLREKSKRTRKPRTNKGVKNGDDKNGNDKGKKDNLSGCAISERNYS